MNNLRLTIDLLPKGAWGNNFSKSLPKKDWDTLRQKCYERYNHRCGICGKEDSKLDAHEEWEFDTKARTQTLKNIIALCSACHGVKHFRNSERIGYGENAKRHFMRINKCDPMAFAKHYTNAQFLFDELNEVLRWKLSANLDRFGGKGIEIKQRNIPLVYDPYQCSDWDSTEIKRVPTKNLLKNELGEHSYTYILDENSASKSAMYYSSQPKKLIRVPKIYSIVTDNYQGTITVVSSYANRIEWIADGKIIKTKYNYTGKFTTKFSVEGLDAKYIRFRLIGEGGVTSSSIFGLQKAS
ncbi:MAG: hypothetical protein FWC11_01495 [Firmicutes bacterium]|nr:hypothetical protein [Bacillota bacterium]